MLLALPSGDTHRVRSVIGQTFTLACLMTLTLTMPVDEYMKDRDGILQSDRGTRIGHRQTLTPQEKIVSDAMVAEKHKLIEESRQGGKQYFPSYSFYRAKPLIENTTVYKIIQEMPKGAALHLHDMALTSLDWVVKNVTYRDNLYRCIDKESFLMLFKFYKVPPKADSNSTCVWKLLKTERIQAADVVEFDLSIKKNLSLLATDPLVTHPSVEQIWHRFNQYFEQVIGLLFYEPVFRDYFREGLKEFMADKVQYFEMRGVFTGVYDLDGNVHGPEYALKIYQEVIKQFVMENPEFSGAKLIYSGIRSVPQKEILDQVKTAIDFRQRYPDLMLGYDLVGQEDPNYSLLHYRDELLYPSQKSIKLPYFFHAAETNWEGTETDYNLIDAILLNTTRIGHGFGLIKHPKLVKMLKEKDIAVEVNPISNQLLGLVKDLRNHGLVPLMADDFPLVVSSDDPAVWEASPLSHDYYMAFMNMCGEDTDLRFLKQLAINSFQYSAMTTTEKKSAMTMWQKKWDMFIAESARSIQKHGNETVTMP